jgi:hypothetical protein
MYVRSITTNYNFFTVNTGKYKIYTCLGAGPEGIWAIVDVTSTTLLLRGKLEKEFSFSGQR